jgi:hypothetical protein
MWAMSDGDELFDASVIGRWARRPVLTAASFLAIAALALGGLYQGYRFTFRNDGPAPHYVWATAAPPIAAPETQPANTDAVAHAARPRAELADNDAAPPADALQSASAVTSAASPTDRAPLIQIAAFPAQQGPAVDPSATALPASDPAQAPDPPPP